MKSEFNKNWWPAPISVSLLKIYMYKVLLGVFFKWSVVPLTGANFLVIWETFHFRKSKRIEKIKTILLFTSFIFDLMIDDDVLQVYKLYLQVLSNSDILKGKLFENVNGTFWNNIFSIPSYPYMNFVYTVYTCKVYHMYC